MVGVVGKILLDIGASLLTKRIISNMLATLVEWAVGTSKTKVDDKAAKPILEKLRNEE